MLQSWSEVTVLSWEFPVNGGPRGISGGVLPGFPDRREQAFVTLT
jgi:hypothetical protein